MTYKVIGIMSGSSLDGLDIAFCEIEETGGIWSYEIVHSQCMPYTHEWQEKLRNAIYLNALDYMRLHTAYGSYIGDKVNVFIDLFGLQHKVQLIASHGHTTFHEPHNKMTGQIGCGGTIAATTGINTVSDLRAMDIALGGQGAPIVPMTEKLLLGDYQYFLNLGGIANLSYTKPNGERIAFDVCPANRVLNMLVSQMGHDFDDGGAISATGTINNELLNKLNDFEFYKLPYPKSLANDFGTHKLYPVVEDAKLTIPEALCTFTEHIAIQIASSIKQLQTPGKMLVCGGGGFNNFLIERIKHHCNVLNVEVILPNPNLINFKEALAMALIGVLRWREENNVLHTVTGAIRSSVGGAVWMGS